jgi:hypothetical protein
MKKFFSILIISSFFGFIPFLQSCSDDDDTVAPVTEVVANDNSFKDFMTWSKDAIRKGADPALGGMAHGGNDSTVTRNIYYKNGQNPVNGVYPVGTIIVKHSSNPDKTVNEFTAMVKRGGEFNKEKGGWEYFMLATDGTIGKDGTMEMRGANLMNGMCAGCHSAAFSKDYIFTK